MSFFDRDNEIAYLRKERSLASKEARLTVVTLDGVQFRIWERELAWLRWLSQMSFRLSAWDRWGTVWPRQAVRAKGACLNYVLSGKVLNDSIGYPPCNLREGQS